MKYVAIIGHVEQAKTTLIEAMVKAVEERTGEKVECIHVNSKDVEFLSQKHDFGNIEPIPFVNTICPDPDIISCDKSQNTKGHQRPYKFHR